ncbi:MAG: Nucleoid-associated protein YbaB [Alphaproteobacteria bacterium MarineAlpha11_Bin1]|nr:MAG: Nucleoid-associated protein YbaB [Alphaproteobacteria bacterium MarineAlpha11_Bin1]|tara:strand:+ start:1593 stop:1916 length:324 start_codon:yes stop_codon:yes gene_type:complete
MKNLGNLMKQAQEMQAKMEQMQNRLAEIEITGESGAGMVRVTLNGKSEMRGLKIDPTLFNSEDAEVVEDLIVAAFNDAKAKAEQQMQEQMAEVTGGLNLPPGVKLPF